jgi:hypothetical protein
MLKGYMGIRAGSTTYHDEVTFLTRDCTCILTSGALVAPVGATEETRSWCAGDFAGNGHVGC